MKGTLMAQRRKAFIAAATTACAAVFAGWYATGTASAGTISGVLYRDPNSNAARWVAANPSDSRAAVIRDKVASQATAHWLSSFNPGTVQSETSTFVAPAHAAGQIPVLSVYEIPNRDCGGASAGGAPDLGQYQSWISSFAAGLGNQIAIVILETDALALQTCLSASDVTARDQALSTATQTIKAADPQAKVYLDGGHSAWNSAADQANRLKAAGVQFADGFFTNVSNFNPTANEAAYGRAVISALNGLGAPGKHQIIDTSRNGGASGDWCADDNTDRRIGQFPTTATSDANIDGYLWVKPPGEADGCAFAAGSFQPALAFSLAQDAPEPHSPPPSSAPASPPASPSPSPASPSPSTVPTTGAPTGHCAAVYQTGSSWQGGFTGQVTITAGTAAITSWTATWTLASGQSITQLWSGTLTVSGSTATVRNLSWNGTLAAGASTMFGFNANGTPSTPLISCS